MEINDYRRRMYDRYITSRSQGHKLGAARLVAFREAHLRKLIAAHFPADRGAKILDLGCGNGMLLNCAKQAGYNNISGIDVSVQQVELAEELGFQGVQQGDLFEAVSSIADASLETVVTFDVIEHFRKGELICFVDEVFRSLRDSGRWIMHVPNAESSFGTRIRYGDFTHEIAFTRDSISQLLLSSGFAQVDCYEDGPVAHGIKSATRWLLWKIIRTGLRLRLMIETGDSGRDAIFSQNLLAVATKR
jgi:2-polyprenyl-3-methyl-5-hydroxy-6-metoxy-1,4-benzoquinol methylase